MDNKNNKKKYIPRNGIEKKCLECGVIFYVFPCYKNKAKFCSKRCLAKNKFTGLKRKAPSTCFKKGNVPYNKGIKRNEDATWNPSEYRVKRVGSKGRIWSKRVISLFNGCCAWCSSREKLHAHHIIPLYLDPSGFYDLKNGLCLCQKCHWGTFNKEKKYIHAGAISLFLKIGIRSEVLDSILNFEEVLILKS